MNDDEARFAVLDALAQRIAEETSGGVVGDALEQLLEASDVHAAIGYAHEGSFRQVAERTREGAVLSEKLRAAATHLAERVFESQKPLSLPNLTAPDAPQDALDVAVGGYTALYGVPIVHWRSALGALLLLSRRPGALDAPSVRLAGAVAHLVALALYRDYRLEEERAQRAELEEAGRMASLGLLTASVAHELRGPVGALVLQLEEQRRMVSGDARPTFREELVELTTDMEVAVARIRGTIEQLSKLSRRDTEPEKLDLGEVVHESLTLARPYLDRRGISLVEKVKSGVRVRGRRDNLAQMLLNLVFNAADACEQSPQPTRRIELSVSEDSSKAVLQVDDTGPGIPESRINTIFRPFFTTKERGKGTGLGLKICSDVVTAHGGHIEVFNRAGGGACFRVLLPIAPQQQKSARPPRRSDAPARPRRIMIVDDDPVFARTLRRGLKHYDVLIASAASEAEIQLTSPGYKPDLVLCDVFLPGVNGNQLHARMKRQDSELAARFVFVTGGALGKEEAEYLKGSGCPTLFKPLNIDDILEMLEEDVPDSRRALVTLSGPAQRKSTSGDDEA